MFAEQGIVVDRLVSVIQRLQLDRCTGILTATRGEDAATETGTIEFINGKVFQANVGRYSNRDALNRLSTWGICRVLFASPGPVEHAAQRGISPPPLSGPLAHSIEINQNHLPGEKNTNPLERRQTTPLPPDFDLAAKKAEALLHTHAQNQGIPYRLKFTSQAIPLIAYHGLSRTHRHLFLLIDGVRTIAELSRLLRHSEQEVSILLLGLQEIACIAMRSPDTIQ